MHQDSKTLTILIGPHSMQVAVLDISRHLSCVATPVKQTIARMPSKYLGGIVIALAVLLLLSIDFAQSVGGPSAVF